MGDPSGVFLAFLLGAVSKTLALQIWCSPKLGLSLKDKPKVKSWQ